MKTKLNIKLTKSIVKIVVLVMLLSLVVFLGFLELDRRYVISDKIASPFKEVDYTDPAIFIKGYKSYIKIEDGKYSLTDTGLRLLKEKDIWLQLLDESGKEVFSVNTDEDILKSYTPYDLAVRYEGMGPENLKTGKFDDMIFVEELKHDGVRYTIILGFSPEKFRTFLVWVDVPHFKRMLVSFPIVVIPICLLLAFLIGYHYSKKITFPIQSILNRIELLSNNVYHDESTDDPFYSDIYDNLNKLSFDLQQAETERTELEKLKSDWISNISHDIKTPLASIRGYSEIMKDYELSEEEIKKYGDILNEKSIYIEELLGELRLSDRLKDKDVTLNLDKTNLVEFSRGLIAEILNSEDNNVNINFSTNKEEIYKDIDQFMFKRVFENLIYNAIYYSKENIEIEVSIEEVDGSVRMRFKDNGIGIGEEDLKNIFNRYYRGSNTKKKGTGLGLAITKDVVEKHGGTIKVESVLDEFTEFIIDFKNMQMN